MNISIASFFTITLIFFGGCMSVPTPHIRQQTLDTIALENHLTSKTIQTSLFSLYTLSDTSNCTNKEMRVYIEGDGLAWVTTSRLSDNPTPINPLAAKLMTLDSSKCKVYLARPCQYTKDNKCTERYWSNRRFSSEVIESYDDALNRLKNEHQISSFTLIGYSGGGAIAALSAARRSDVKELISVAGNLDTDKWIELHRISALEGSLNPANFSSKLKSISQTHLIGAKDTVIPQAVFQSYKKNFPNDAKIKSIVCEKCTHNDGWIQEWKEFLKQR